MDPEKTKASGDEEHERYSRHFCFVLQSGAVLYPVRMRNRDTGRFAFRLSKGGNTKDLGIEVENEDRMTELALEQEYAIRMRSLDGRTTGLYRPNGRSVREVRILGGKGGRLK